ncbi:CRISPR-associated endonuclease Cas2 [Ferruginivarius sediminum]|uniref:CRISPR-associated endoribonuclease Cas2 n=2 Tax=Ferruginivarius sediminum TaxID=2661937 RepID=A0A369TA09_9PROT|nr:CRISPR-associated endonuclease Cas2 [Ferruginivarius sediminum]
MPDGWRKMWVLVFYDLPVAGPNERRAARKFHEFLVRQGFDRVHYSIYNRFCGSMERANTYERRVEKAVPKRGYVCLLKLTDRQMANMRRWIKGGYDPHESAQFTPPEQYRLF